MQLFLRVSPWKSTLLAVLYAHPSAVMHVKDMHVSYQVQRHKSDWFSLLKLQSNATNVGNTENHSNICMGIKKYMTIYKIQVKFVQSKKVHQTF